MKMWQFYLILSVIYIAPNMTSTARVLFALAMLVVAVFSGIVEVVK